MAASAAIVYVSLRVDFTAIARTTIAIGVARIAADAASSSGTGPRAVGT